MQPILSCRRGSGGGERSLLVIVIVSMPLILLVKVNQFAIYATYALRLSESRVWERPRVDSAVVRAWSVPGRNHCIPRRAGSDE